MSDEMKNSQPAAMPVGSVHSNVTQQLQDGAGIVLFVSLHASGANTSIALYDGHSTLGRKIHAVAALSDDSKAHSIEVGLPFHDGLYVAVENANAYFTIVWVPTV